MSLALNRPTGLQGKGDAHLPKIARRLQKRLAETQRGFTYDTLRLSSSDLHQLADLLVDFAEDLHNDLGIWKAYESYNVQFFGTALPLIRHAVATTSDVWTADRFQHLLWVLFPTFVDGLILSPSHRDLRQLAASACEFLADAFRSVPRDSGIRAFLATPDDHGWKVKRKLLWLGRHSYLFRRFFANAAAKSTDKMDAIAMTDDFVCQECTVWSGLGVIDVLAEVLEVSQDDRIQLRNWYERHAAFYKVLSVDGEVLNVLNVINDRPYRVDMNGTQNPFLPGQIVFGSLVPWRDMWNWSGAQNNWGNDRLDVQYLQRTMKQHNSPIVCRYSPDYEAQVRKSAAFHHERMLQFYGTDLSTYSDGIAMAADWQREVRAQWEAQPEEAERVIQRHGLTKGRPGLKLPPDLLEHNDGIGVFLNPDLGKEIMTHFVPLIAGLKKRGENLTQTEQNSICGFFQSSSISPQFVNRVISEFGDESVREAFVLRGELPNYWLEYLLRRFKGRYYRKHYPGLALVD